MQIHEQHRRAGPSRHQTDHSFNAGFQVILEARIIIAGIETMHTIRKGQMDCPAGQPMSAAQQFYSLAV